MAARQHSRGTVPQAASGASKVPAVKPYFWVVKLLTTCMGEAVSDFVVLDVNKYLGVILGFAVFVAAIIWQFRVPRYRTWPYWTAVAMVAVFGTMAADVMHVVLGLTYLVAALFYAVCLIVTFSAWYRTEGTLDIHSIVTRRREVFYWLAVIFTFAMGTALGDLFATTFRLGYFTSAVVFTLAICVPLVAWRLGVNPVLTFWVAYVLTRPIGASFADYFGMPKDISGAGYGHGAVSVVTIIAVVASFVYLSRSGIDQPETGQPAAAPAGQEQPPQLQYPAGAPPQYGGGPQYGRNPQYGGGPQYDQNPRYNGGPQYDGNARYDGRPRYDGSPRHGGDPRYDGSPQDDDGNYQYGGSPQQYGHPQYGDRRDYRPS
jgi:uncharacterized membrane-anchored protein